MSHTDKVFAAMAQQDVYYDTYGVCAPLESLCVCARPWKVCVCGAPGKYVCARL